MGKRIRIKGGAVSLAGPTLQWEFDSGNRAVVDRVLTFLEDRRVLWQTHRDPAFAQQFPDMANRIDAEYCRRSADKIREVMTRERPNVRQGDDVYRALTEIRSAAQDFVEHAGPDSKYFVTDLSRFWEHLEEMRGRMGPQILSLAMAYEVQLDPRFRDGLPRQDLSFVPGFE